MLAPSSSVKKLIRHVIVVFSLAMLAACQSGSSALKPVSAGALTEEYERSSTMVRSKYDGKEITVTGYTLIGASMPAPGADQGSVLLAEKGSDPVWQVTCWFSREQAEAFSKVKGGQYVTVKGVFNGEAGAELKFCKLIRVE